jgi:hypothetical protein
VDGSTFRLMAIWPFVDDQVASICTVHSVLRSVMPKLVPQAALVAPQATIPLQPSWLPFPSYVPADSARAVICPVLGVSNRRMFASAVVPQPVLRRTLALARMGGGGGNDGLGGGNDGLGGGVVGGIDGLGGGVVGGDDG